MATNNSEIPLITKSSGERVPFSPEKLVHSLKRAGAPQDVAESIIQNVISKVHNGISTRKLYQLAFKQLRGKSRPLAARYRLKTAIMELGPSGYPFEKFIGEVLRCQGFSVEVGVVVKGRCVNHEVDVLASKSDEIYLVECKYHNQHATINTVKIPLYIQARFEDIKAAWREDSKHKGKLQQGFVVSNTRFTTDAIQYGSCVGLKLIGWNYPRKGNLQDLIESEGLYPLTCLTSLKKYEKKQLLSQNIVLCQELVLHPENLVKLGIKSQRLDAIKKEAAQLSQHLFAYENF